MCRQVWRKAWDGTMARIARLVRARLCRASAPTRGPAMQENAAATESALTDRLRFVKLDAKSAERVRELKPIIERELPIGLDKFYDQVRVTEEARKFFRGEDHISNARKAQLNHWQ